MDSFQAFHTIFVGLIGGNDLFGRDFLERCWPHIPTFQDVTPGPFQTLLSYVKGCHLFSQPTGPGTYPLACPARYL
jgi:hypothetical protein